jgi:hypothetical protein
MASLQVQDRVPRLCEWRRGQGGGEGEWRQGGVEWAIEVVVSAQRRYLVSHFGHWDAQSKKEIKLILFLKKK